MIYPMEKPKPTRKKKKSPLDGRPTVYREEFVQQAYIACTDGGFTNRNLAKLFGVHINTIINWIREIKEFGDAVRKGKDEYDSAKIEKALNRRALGFRYTETIKEVDSENAALAVTKTIRKFIPPDTKACEIWLCNRNPARWKKLKYVELTGKDGEKLIDCDLFKTLLGKLPKNVAEELMQRIVARIKSESSDNTK